MSRAVDEWIGKNDDSAIPTRVRTRVVDRQDWLCAGCGRPLAAAGERVEIDHITALINGGENRESNLQALCGFCHAPKTRADVAEKSKTARRKAKRLGFEKAKRKIPGSKGTGLRKPLNGPAYRVKE